MSIKQIPTNGEELHFTENYRKSLPKQAEILSTFDNFEFNCTVLNEFNWLEELFKDWTKGVYMNDTFFIILEKWKAPVLRTPEMRQHWANFAQIDIVDWEEFIAKIGTNSDDYLVIKSLWMTWSGHTWEKRSREYPESNGELSYLQDHLDLELVEQISDNISIFRTTLKENFDKKMKQYKEAQIEYKDDPSLLALYKDEPNAEDMRNREIQLLFVDWKITSVLKPENAWQSKFLTESTRFLGKWEKIKNEVKLVTTFTQDSETWFIKYNDKYSWWAEQIL